MDDNGAHTDRSKKKKAGSTAAFVTHSPEMSLNVMSVPTKSVLTLG